MSDLTRVTTTISRSHAGRLNQIRQTGFSIRSVVEAGIDLVYNKLVEAGLVKLAYFTLMGIVINRVTLEQQPRTLTVRATDRVDAFWQAAVMLYQSQQVWFSVPEVVEGEVKPTNQITFPNCDG